MSINDTIQYFLDNGANTFTVGKSKEGELFVKVEQWVSCGVDGNNVVLFHQAAKDSLPVCLERLRKQFNYASEMGDIELKRAKNSN
jgi:hypothetical protein